MIKILSSPIFLQFIVPLITILLAVFVKFATKKENPPRLKREDWAIGNDVALTAAILIISDLGKSAKDFSLDTASNSPHNAVDLNKIATGPWIIFAVILFIWGLSTLVRLKGWNQAGDMHWWAVLLGIFFGIGTLLLSVAWIGT